MKWTENYTGIKVIGVVPFVKNVKLPEEDSLVTVRQSKNYGEHELVDTLTDDDDAFNSIADVLSKSLDVDYVLRLIRREDTTLQPQ